jgi:hypothetical protein
LGAVIKEHARMGMDIMTAGKTARRFQMKKTMINKKMGMVLVLAMLIAGGVFAQDNQGYIKPTFGPGFSTGKVQGYSATLTTLALDVDFVTTSGLTFGMQDAMAWNDEVGAEPFIAFGFGYTYAFNSANELFMQGHQLRHRFYLPGIHNRMGYVT